ncbi:MAG: hypothetical protein H8E12_16805 [Rhodobacteraceae bacterium]|nr:hypothetical protein [Paracoccaceae bacterium]
MLLKLGFKTLKLLKMTQGAPFREYSLFRKGEAIGKLSLDKQSKRVIRSEVSKNMRNKGFGTEMYRKVLKQEGALYPDKEGLLAPGAKGI